MIYVDNDGSCQHETVTVSWVPAVQSVFSKLQARSGFSTVSTKRLHSMEGSSLQDMQHGSCRLLKDFDQIKQAEQVSCESEKAWRRQPV